MGPKRFITLGLFFMIGLGCVLFLAMFTQDFTRLFGEKKYLYVKFDNVAGLREGDSVRVNGLELGRIDALILRQDLSQVIVRIALYQQTLDFYEGYKIKIQESSLIGGRFLNIIPKPDPKEEGVEANPKLLPKEYGQDEAHALEGSSELPAFDRIGTVLEKLKWEEISAAFKKLSTSLDSFGEKGKDTVDDVRKAARKAAETLEAAEKIAARINEGPGPAYELIHNQQLADDLKALVAKSRKIAEDVDRSDIAKTTKELTDLSAQAREVFEKINKGQGTLGALVNERGLYDEMQKVSENLRDISSAIREKESVMGRMVYDKEMGGELRDAIHELRQVTINLGKMTQNANPQSTVGRLMSDDSLYKKADEALTGLSQTLGTVSRLKLFVDVEDKYYSESLMNVAKAHLTLYPAQNKFLSLGVAQMSVDGDSDITTKDNRFDGDSEGFTKLDAQLGYKFFDNRLTLRGGVLEGKPGAGIDYDLEVPGIEHDVRLTFEGRGSYNHVEKQDIDEHISGPLLRFEISSRVLKYFRPYVGVSRLGANEEFFGGIMFQYEDEDISKLIGAVSAAGSLSK